MIDHHQYAAENQLPTATREDRARVVAHMKHAGKLPFSAVQLPGGEWVSVDVWLDSILSPNKENPAA